MPGWESDEPIGALPTNPLQHELERAHRFSGSGFPVGIIRVLDRGAVNPDATLVTYGGAEITSGSWSFAFSPDDIPALVLELHSGGVAYRTAALTLQAGGATAATPADFASLPLPHMFRGVDLWVRHVIAQALSGNGSVRGGGQQTIRGVWSVSIKPEHDPSDAIRLSAEIDGERRWTREFPLTPGGETRVSAGRIQHHLQPLPAQRRRRDDGGVARCAGDG